MCDPELKEKLAAIVSPIIRSLFMLRHHYFDEAQSPDTAIAVPRQKMMRPGLYMAEHLHEAPVLMVACLDAGGQPVTLQMGASIYGAVQNLWLATRAFGIGGTVSVVLSRRQDEVKALLGIPDGVDTAAMLPLGYPKGLWGIAPRRGGGLLRRPLG